MQKILLVLLCLPTLIFAQYQIGQDIDGEAANDNSGMAVSTSIDGTTIAIGAPYNDGNGSDAGHVKIFRLIGGNWIQLGQDIDGEASADESGRSVSLSADGNFVAIGGPNNESASPGGAQTNEYQ